MAAFARDFGQRALLTVDTEEEFDWNGPFRRDGFGLSHLVRLAGFQEFCEGMGVVPLYLLDWPVATSPIAREILAPAIAAGRAEVGAQLHPWVNPPFTEHLSNRNSFAGNLPPEIEAEKLRRLRDAIREGFATDPITYRAGRYGLGPQTAGTIAEMGFAVDTSVRANHDYSPAEGPDFSGHPLRPYWSDREKRLLELPVTTVFTGRLRKQGRLLNRLGRHIPHVGGAMSRLGLLERVALTPEGVTIEEALRGVDAALDDGLPLLVFSFHSPSLAPGHTPYVRDDSDVDRLYDWFRAIYARLDERGVRPTTVTQIITNTQV